MPVYDYTCAECGAFELVRRISERNENASCPQCDTGADDAGSYGMRHGGSCACRR
ncbi:MAG: hypothetical protein CPDRYMAC_1106 [uncultured Paraburkholderia sp.]|nr:MAG: hypothetical protein CPDRYDRY_1083 [uncultured Paraburkholderia sp.]CAH2915933.1 MAG: hypothetical protein CPDRYMAC_1106 [uncultured Paraburkholderia sp.]